MLTRIAKEFANSPIATICAFISTLIALSSVTAGTLHLETPVTELPIAGHGFWFGIAILFGAALPAAYICRLAFAKSGISSFILSIILAGLTIALATYALQPYLPIGLKNSGGRDEGPVIDLIYWSILLIFCLLNAEPIVKDFAVSTLKPGDGISGESLVGMCGALILGLLVWGGVLGAAQNRITAIFLSSSMPSG